MGVVACLAGGEVTLGLELGLKNGLEHDVFTRLSVEVLHAFLLILVFEGFAGGLHWLLLLELGMAVAVDHVFLVH